MNFCALRSKRPEPFSRILNLRRSLAAAEFRIEELEANMAELSARRETLEKARSRHIRGCGRAT